MAAPQKFEMTEGMQSLGVLMGQSGNAIGSFVPAAEAAGPAATGPSVAPDIGPKL